MKTLTPRWQHVIMGQWIALATLLVSTIIMYTAFTRIAECQDTYMTKDYKATQARVSLADQERQSLSEVFAAIVSGNRERVGSEIRQHAALLAENDKIRAKNPQPELPTAC